MYVLSSLPLERQSIAGSLVQTLSRICTAVGYGVATAIFNGVTKKPSTSGFYANNPAEPYAAVFWFAAGVSALGVLLVPWLKIGTQGGQKKEVESLGGDVDAGRDSVDAEKEVQGEKMV